MNVIYHKNCMDGLAAAAATKRVLGDSASYNPMQYGDTMNCPHCQKAIPSAEFQRELGRKKSDAKAAAARANGKKGGRPKKKPAE